MYQTKPSTYHQRKGKNTIVSFRGYYNVFRINSDVKRPYNMNTFVKKKFKKKLQKGSLFLNNLTQNIANDSFSFGVKIILF